MLSTMRKSVSGIFAKLLLGLLVCSFGLWGIGDMLRQTSAPVAVQVGDVRISPADVRQRVERVAAQIPKELRQSINGKLLEREVLQGLVQQQLLLQESSRLGFRVGDAAIAESIKNNVGFRDSKGAFDSSKFKALLQANRVSEAGFVATLKQDIVAASLLQSITSSADHMNFETLNRQLARANAQQRSGELYIISHQNKNIKTPDDKELRAYYAELQQEYMQPERRDIAYIAFDKSNWYRQLEKHITEDAVSERYASDKAMFTSEETRNVTQWLFKEKQDAASAYIALSKDTNPSSTIATKPVAMKAITATSLPKAAASSVFAATLGEITPPVKTSFGWHVFRVDAISAGKVTPLDEVRTQIIASLVEEVRDDALQSLIGSIEDALAAGDDINTAAQQLKLGAHAKTLDAAYPADKESVQSLDGWARKTGFSLEEGEVSSAGEVGKEMIIATTLRIIPQAPKKFDAVKSEIQQRFINERTQQMRAEYAAEIARKLNTSSNQHSTARTLGVSIRTTGAITLAQAMRASASNATIIPATLQQRMFDVALGEMTAPTSLADGRWALVKVTSIHQPEPSKDTKAGDTDAVRKGVLTSMQAMYLRHLEKQFPVIFPAAQDTGKGADITTNGADL